MARWGLKRPLLPLSAAIAVVRSIPKLDIRGMPTSVEQRASSAVGFVSAVNLNLLLAKQSSNDTKPLRIERLAADWLTRSTVPVCCVAVVAFLSMKVGMHPRSFDTFVLLGGFVRSLPIALAIPPQSGEGVREPRWRLSRGE